MVSPFATLPANSGPFGLAFDGSGNLYAADYGPGQISKITSGGVVSLFATLPANSRPEGLAFDAAATSTRRIGSPTRSARSARTASR